MQEAGEKVFVDLLPESWTSLPPPLPPEIVADLARRARSAEAILKSRNPAPVRRPLGVEVAKLPTLTRLTVRLPEGAEAKAMARLMELHAAQALLDRPLQSFDLRLPDRMVVRPAEAPLPLPPAASPRRPT